MKKDLEREAVQLRKQGSSIGSIADTLQISRSTASRWCAGIELSQKQKTALEKHRKEAGIKALTPWIERNRKLKMDDLLLQEKLGRKDAANTSKRDLFMLGLGLYWGEGYKKGSQECGFTNSDPVIIRTILNWFRTCYNIDMSRVNARLTINILYKDEAPRITHAWAKETGIPLSQFSSPTFITGYGKPLRDKNSYRGTLRIKIRNGTSLRRRILASIASIGN